MTHAARASDGELITADNGPELEHYMIRHPNRGWVVVKCPPHERLTRIPRLGEPVLGDFWALPHSPFYWRAT